VEEPADCRVSDGDDKTPAEAWSEDFTRRALDELFNLARKYRTGESYGQLMKFVARFRSYAPYNAMLVHIQMPGAAYVAPPERWLRRYGRTVKPAARPLIILRPMGPVMFVFDVSDTEPGPDAEPLPPEVTHPYEVREGHAGFRLERTMENAKRDGVSILTQKAGSQAAGSICTVTGGPGRYLLFESGMDEKNNPIFTQVPLRYTLLLSESLSREARYATMVHELAHLYCGHLGTPDDRWWPDRRGATKTVREFEAESVTYLVCSRLGIDNPSAEYLAHYVMHCSKVPAISLECVMKAAGLIEQMGSKHQKLRPDRASTQRERQAR
jgi:hypothetical protein